jgi:hypothetical protein
MISLQKSSKKSMFVIGLVSLFALLFGGCGVITEILDIGPTSTPTVDPSSGGKQPLVIDPVTAREYVLAFIRANYEGYGPPAGLIWSEQDTTPEGLVGSSSTRYSAEDWTVDVIYPVVAPEVTVYTVSISNDTGDFQWDGTIDADGQVAETSVSAGED